MKVLTKDMILGVDDLKKVELDMTPYGWSGSIFVRTWTGGERDLFDQSVLKNKTSDEQVNMSRMRAKIAVLSICDENGNRLFEDGDEEAVSKKSAHALDKVMEVSSKLNGLTLKDINELTKNFEATKSDSSSTD